MTESEGRALLRTASVLFVASLVRWGLTARQPPPLLPPDSLTALPALLDESRRKRDEEERRRTPLADGETLDPNVATAIELDRLPGVGPATADAIVAGRAAKGRYDRPEDLLSVRGIGPATLARIRERLEFTSPRPGRPGRPERPARPEAPPPPPPGAPRASGVGGRAAGAVPLDLNRASREELEGLPGVGPALAGRILAERERRGAFSTPDDLLAVRGIGPATLERLRPRIVVP